MSFLFSNKTYIFFWDIKKSVYQHHLYRDFSFEDTHFDILQHVAISIDGNFYYHLFDPVTNKISISSKGVKPYYASDLPLNTVRQFDAFGHNSSGIKNTTFASVIPRFVAAYDSLSISMFKSMAWIPSQHSNWHGHFFDIMVRLAFPPVIIYEFEDLRQESMVQRLKNIKTDMYYSSDFIVDDVEILHPHLSALVVADIFLKGLLVKTSSALQQSLRGKMVHKYLSDYQEPLGDHIVHKDPNEDPIVSSFYLQDFQRSLMEFKQHGLLNFRELSWEDFYSQVLIMSGVNDSLLLRPSDLGSFNTVVAKSKKIFKEQLRSREILLTARLAAREISQEVDQSSDEELNFTPLEEKDYDIEVQENVIEDLLVGSYILTREDAEEQLRFMYPYSKEREDFKELLKNPLACTPQENFDLGPKWDLWVFVWQPQYNAGARCSYTELGSISLCIDGDFTYCSKKYCLDFLPLDRYQFKFPQSTVYSHNYISSQYSEKINQIERVEMGQFEDKISCDSWHLLDDIYFHKRPPDIVFHFPYKNYSEYVNLRKQWMELLYTTLLTPSGVIDTIDITKLIYPMILQKELGNPGYEPLMSALEDVKGYFIGPRSSEKREEGSLFCQLFFDTLFKLWQNPHHPCHSYCYSLSYFLKNIHLLRSASSGAMDWPSHVVGYQSKMKFFNPRLYTTGTEMEYVHNFTSFQKELLRTNKPEFISIASKLGVPF